MAKTSILYTVDSRYTKEDLKLYKGIYFIPAYDFRGEVSKYKEYCSNIANILIDELKNNGTDVNMVVRVTKGFSNCTLTKLLELNPLAKNNITIS